MEKVIVEVEVKEGKSNTNLQKVEKNVEGIGKAAEKSKKGVKNFGKTVGNLTKSLGIVGLLAAAFEVLQEAFKNNQQVMDAVSTATTALGIVMNDLYRLVADNLSPIVEKISKAFSDLPGTFEKVKKAIKENLEVRFNALVKTLGLVGKAISQVFSGDFADAAETAKEAGKTYVDVFTGVENSVDKVADGFGKLVDKTKEYVTETVSAADAITKAEKSLVILENTQTRVREKADRDAERQRQIRDDYTKGIDERIEANDKLGKILEEQQKNELAAVDAQIAALSLRLSLDKNNQDLKNQIYALNTERFAVEAQQEGFRSEQQKNAIDLEKEKLELAGFQTIAQKEAYDEEVRLAEEKQAKLDKIADDAKAKELKRIDDIKKAEETAKDNKLNIASEGLKAVSQFAEEGTELAKGVALANVSIDVAKGLTGALSGWSSLGPFGIAGAVASSAAIIASGIASVRNITKAKVGSKPTTTPPSVGSANIAPPTFNAPTNDNNQLAETFAGALANKPVKAYVVSGDVTTAQQMDRITNDNATL